VRQRYVGEQSFNSCNSQAQCTARTMAVSPQSLTSFLAVLIMGGVINRQERASGGSAGVSKLPI